MVLKTPAENRRVVKDAISLGFLRIQQANENVIVLSMGAVTVLKISETQATVVH